MKTKKIINYIMISIIFFIVPLIQIIYQLATKNYKYYCLGQVGTIIFFMAILIYGIKRPSMKRIKPKPQLIDITTTTKTRNSITGEIQTHTSTVTKQRYTKTYLLGLAIILLSIAITVLPLLFALHPMQIFGTNMLFGYVLPLLFSGIYIILSPRLNK